MIAQARNRFEQMAFHLLAHHRVALVAERRTIPAVTLALRPQSLAVHCPAATGYSTLAKSGSRSRDDTTTPPGFSTVTANMKAS